MISAIDSNILLDILIPDPKFGPASKMALEDQSLKGKLTICEIVYSEVASLFPTQLLFDKTLSLMQIKLSPLTRHSSFQGGHLWRLYRQAGGLRTRILADFLIAAHAESQADQLITRDRGFYRKYFPGLCLIEP